MFFDCGPWCWALCIVFLGFPGFAGWVLVFPCACCFDGLIAFVEFVLFWVLICRFSCCGGLCVWWFVCITLVRFVV